MKKLMQQGVLALAVFLSAIPVVADEVVPIEPCRLLDTRSGIPVQGLSALDVAARDLCGIPVEATAVVANLTVISPAGAGYLKAYGTATAPDTAVLTYNSGQTVTTSSAIVGLSWDVPSTSSWDLPAWDLRLLTSQTAHVVVDVTGYLTRKPVRDFRGEVEDADVNFFPTAIVWKLGGYLLPAVCVAPWIDLGECDALDITDEACGTGHIEHYSGGPYPAGPHLIVDSLEACP